MDIKFLVDRLVLLCFVFSPLALQKCHATSFRPQWFWWKTLLVALIRDPLFMMSHGWVTALLSFSKAPCLLTSWLYVSGWVYLCLSFLEFFEIFLMCKIMYLWNVGCFSHYFFKYSFYPFLFCPSETPIILMLVPLVSEILFIFLHFFFCSLY